VSTRQSSGVVDDATVFAASAVRKSAAGP